MERSQHLLPQKCSSFSSPLRDDKLKKPGRSLSLGAITDIIETISEDVKKQELKDPEESPQPQPPPPQLPFDLFSISEDVDKFLHSSFDEDKQQQDIPESVIERFTELLEKELAKYDNNDAKWSDDIEGVQLLDAVKRLSKLTSLLSSTFSANPKSRNAINLTGGLLHHVMTFLEEEFYTLLEDSRTKLVSTTSTTAGQKPKRPPSFRASVDHDRCLLPTATAMAAAESNNNNNNNNQEASAENVVRLKRIASEMIAAGYDAECVQVFTIARSNSLDASICNAGFEKISIDDVQRMQWEPLEASIATWIKAFRQAFTVNFRQELELCDAVFSDRLDIARGVFRNLTRGIIVQFLDFAEAVAMTKRSAEKLFKVLDMYETLRDAAKQMDEMFSIGISSEKEEDVELALLSPLDLKSEMTSAWSRLGEAAVANFCDLESSIKAEAGKTPVPGGAVHPVTRYVINYLTYAIEYNETLEQVFHEHKKSEKPSSMHDVDRDDSHSSSSNNNNNNLSAIRNSSSGPAANNEDETTNKGDEQSPFAVQVMEVMDLLHQNVEAKSKLYKDQSLSNIFLMNNGRYVMQKVKGSEEIKKLVGDTWCRKRSAEMRQYHKNYQRETWGRVLACFKDEGLQVNGKVMKPVLKERFKSFNGMFEETHKTQSVWVVSDEQLQSELRVSVSAVVVPAYRSFLGRFQQYFSPGRQTEKYIKYAPEDLETFIDELFDGNATSMVKRRT